MANVNRDSLILECPTSLKTAFKLACIRQGTDMSKQIREYMASYARKNGEPLARPSQMIG